MELNLKDIGRYAFSPKVETYEEMKVSFFADVYASAQKCVDDILGQYSIDNNDNSFSEQSNIVAFTGGRGTGKTSAMLSMANILKKKKRIDNQSYAEADKFIVLEMIEPSNITAEETVTDVILSHIYTFFEQERKEKCENDEISPEQTRKVYQAFDETYQAVRMACRSRENRYDLPSGIEGLDNIAAGNKLRKLIKNLINIIFNALFRDSYVKPKPCFVLCVDDVDMNIQQGYEICEDLRKYFIIPGIIILFSLSTEQMSDVIRQRYMLDFKTLLDSNRYSRTYETIPDMAAKYMEKLIPFGRRCVLPDMQIANISKLFVFDGEKRRMLVDEILWLLYDKTGLILIKNSFNTHAFIPSSLRSVMHLLHLLNRMESVHLFPRFYDENNAFTFEYPDENEQKKLERNLNMLLNFLYEYDLKEIPTGSANILKELSICPRDLLNKRIIRLLLHEIEDGVSSRRESQKNGMVEILSVPDQSVTMGDLFSFARYYLNAVHNFDNIGNRFFELFRIIYSIRMIQCFFLDSSDENEKLNNAKLRLFKFLGGMIYSPYPEVIRRRGGIWRSNLPLELLDIYKNNVQYDDLLDELIFGVAYLGIPDNNSLQINGWDQFRKEQAGAYYSDVSRENLSGGRGNTYRYFTYNYLGFILSPLRTGLIRDNTNYVSWRKKFISPLPILSADFIDYYMQRLNEASENALKSGKTILQAIWEGTRSLTLEILDQSILEATKTWFLRGIMEFPYVDVDGILNDFLKNEVEDKARRHLRAAPIIPKAQITESEKTYRIRLRNARSKYIGLQKNVSLDYLRDSMGVALQGNKIIGKEREKGEQLNEKIRNIKAAFFAIPERSEDDYKRTIDQIISMINNELDQ